MLFVVESFSQINRAIVSSVDALRGIYALGGNAGVEVV
jgi:hypothetical protein